MKNRVEIRGETAVIFMSNKKGEVFETIIDANDLEIANKIDSCWYAAWMKQSGCYYVLGSYKDGNGNWKKALLHRWLFGLNTVYQIDHRNHDTFDNRRSINLREVTQQQNNQNCNGARITSKTGIRGVSWNKQSKKYMAQICINRKKYNLGYYSDIREAERVVIEARRINMPYSEMDKVV